MAITYEGAGTQGNSTAQTTPGMPGSATTDDILILVIEGEGEDTSADSPPTGGAWTAIDGSTGSVASATDGAVDRTRCSVYWAVYDAGINLTVPDAGDHVLARVHAFRGVDTSAPIHVVTSGSSSTNATSHTANASATSTTIDGCLVVLTATHGDDGTTIGSAANTSLTNVTLQSAVTTNSGSDGTLLVITGDRATAGSMGSFTWGSGVSEEDAWFVFALKPASVGASATGTPTLGAATVTGTATSQQQADATGTVNLAAATVTGTATRQEHFTSTGTATLPAVTTTGTAEQTAAATGTITGAAATVTGTAAQTNAASGSITLPAVTTAGVGEQTATATSAILLGAVTVTGTGTEVQPVTATGAVTLAAITTDGTGAQAFTSTGAATLPAATVTGTAEQLAAATGAITVPAVTTTGAATQTHAADGAVTLPTITATGAAAQANQATGAIVTVAPTFDGTGAIAVAGTGIVGLPSVAVDGTGEAQVELTATGAIVIGGVEVAGTGANGAYVAPAPPAGGHRPYYYRPEPRVVYRPELRGDGALTLGALAAAGQGRTMDDEVVLELLLGISDVGI